MLAVLVPVERRAAQPVLPLWLFRRRAVAVTSAISFLVGALIVGLSSYVPTLGQDVLGASAIVSGFALAAMTLGWPISASQAGRLYLSVGFRATGLLGGAVAVVGAAVLVFVNGTGSLWSVAAGCLLIGWGMGWVAAPALVVAQSSVAWGERGVVTGTNMFARSLGSAVGVAVFGAVVNATVGGHPAPSLLAEGVQRVFIGVLAVTVVIVALEVLMPVRAATPAPQGSPEGSPEGSAEG
jgi:MFS family permease